MGTLVRLALAFAQIGAGTFGGGMSVLPLIEYQFVTRTAWLAPAEFSRLVALAQIAPGPIAVNAATLVGYQQGGLAGSVVSVAAMTGAPLLLVTLALALLGRASPERAVRFRQTIAPLAAALLTLAMIPPLRATAANGPWALALFALSVPLITKVAFFKKYPILLFLLAGAAALALPR